MKQIVAFQTSDKKTFTSRIDAENHEMMIFIRGVVQSKGISAQPSITEMAEIIVKNQDAIYARLQKFRRTLQGLEQAAQQKMSGNKINLTKSAL